MKDNDKACGISDASGSLPQNRLEGKTSCAL